MKRCICYSVLLVELVIIKNIDFDRDIFKFFLLNKESNFLKILIDPKIKDFYFYLKIHA